MSCKLHEPGRICSMNSIQLQLSIQAPPTESSLEAELVAISVTGSSLLHEIKG